MILTGLLNFFRKLHFCTWLKPLKRNCIPKLETASSQLSIDVLELHLWQRQYRVTVAHIMEPKQSWTTTMSEHIAGRTCSRLPLPSEDEDDGDYHPYTPLVKEVLYKDGTQETYKPMTISADDQHEAKVSMPLNIDVSVASIQEMFLPDPFLKSIVRNSNLYGRTKGDSFVPITYGDVLQFLAVVLYMGVVKLPSKEDYWNNTGMWPKHFPCEHFPYTRFKNVWTNIHLTRPNAVDGNNNENNNSDDDACNDNDNNQDDNQPNKHWYDKAAPFIDQVNLASTKVCRFPSFSLLIDEMMKLFKVKINPKI